MDRDERVEGDGPGRMPRSACLVPGCPCKDARIVSRRRAQFFADLARAKGETARRVIRPEPDWVLPTNA
jgi:hypothetical protein